MTWEPWDLSLGTEGLGAEIKPYQEGRRGRWQDLGSPAEEGTLSPVFAMCSSKASSFGSICPGLWV